MIIYKANNKWNKDEKCVYAEHRIIKEFFMKDVYLFTPVRHKKHASFKMGN